LCTRLCCKKISLGYEKRLVVEELDLSIPDRGITSIVGANGSGKSTLLKSMARVLRPVRGAVLLDGRAIHTQPTKEVARILALLPQGIEAPAGLRVEELVAYGRFPYQKGFGVPSPEDRGAVTRALEVTGTAGLAHRVLNTLSGGERQRAWIAMALAQETDLLLLDEPTTALDIRHQIEVLDLIRRMNREQGITVVMVLHDLNHAARYSDRVVALRSGRIAAQGPPRSVLTAKTLAEVFGVDADVIFHERTGALLCVPFEAKVQAPSG
jgi:iron complex transport system ATP-binding protein